MIYQQALQIVKQLGELRGQAIILNNIGSLLEDQGQINKALAHYQQALDLAKQLGDLRGQAAMLSNVGGFLQDQGWIDKA
ncbi:MAG: tetratricopeptide repeat protein, partial [Candidatus Hodarchaeota archaeon]